MPRDFYAVLEVGRNADLKEIKAAYRRLARRHHPDVNPNDKDAENRFKEISEAYEVLSDPEKRKLYDQFGHNWESARQAKNAGYPPPGDGGYGEGFETIFENLFGFGSGGRGGFRVNFDDIQTAQPRNVEIEVELTLEEVHRGSKRSLTYQTADAVQTRDGGIATVPTQKTSDVNFPAGITEGKKLRVPGKGAKGLNGKTGDLYITIRWKKHDKFTVKGDALETDIVVPYVVAALGGDALVETLQGPLTIQIPAGTQSHQVFRLADRGIAKMGGGVGDLLARVRIAVPKQLIPEERRLLEAIRALSGGQK